MANNLKQLDAFQVIRSAYDPVENRLRVDAQLSGSIGEIDVNIDHTEDSIRLGDGTNFLTSTTSGSDVGLDVNIIGNSGDPLEVELEGLTLPLISNIAVPTANTEQSLVIPAGTKRLEIKSRNRSKIQVATSNGASGTTFFTIPMGVRHVVTDLNLTSSVTLYFQMNKAGDTLEVYTWT